jgi:hypothetical protein
VKFSPLGDPPKKNAGSTHTKDFHQKKGTPKNEKNS